MAELELWMRFLRKTINPQEDNVRRTDVSLKLWIQEAKNCQAKKRYFCEIALDRAVYARTSTKTKGDMLFWGEQFEFDNLPPINSLTLTLFKETNDKRKLRQVWPSSSGSDRGAVAIGSVAIPVSELLNRQVSEQWYSVSPVLPLSSTAPSSSTKSYRDSKTSSTSSSTAGTSGDGLPQIRVKARYQAVQVLPLALYNDLSQYVQHNYLSLVAELEPLLTVRAKDDVATVLVNILHHEGKATTFLCDIVMADVLKQENSHVVFRGNTIATKAIEAYMKLVSTSYLRLTLGECVRTILESGDDCEVDSSKLLGSGSSSSGGSVSQSVLVKHQACLIKYCEQVWAKIAGSLAQFPSELRDVFAAFRGRCRELGKADLADNLISACVFLRLLCPAIMSPNLFGLCQEFPDERASRTLTLVAKTIQSLANFTKFGGKEDYMLHMNEFVDREWARMHEYLQKISSIDSKYRRVDYQGRIDVAKHLSLLHSLLVEEARSDGGANVSTATSSASSAGTTTGSPTELRRRLQPLLQRLTDELLHGEDSVLSSAAIDGPGAASERRAAQSDSVRRSRPLSAGDHAAAIAKDGCVPPAAARASMTSAAAALSAADAAVRVKDVQPAEMLPPWSNTRQAAAHLPSATVATASGERHMTVTGTYGSRPTGCLSAYTDGCSGGGGGGDGGGKHGEQGGRQLLTSTSAGGGCGGGGNGPLSEPTVDSAYDTLRSIGSQSEATTGSMCSAGAGSMCSTGTGSHGGRPSEAMCGAYGSTGGCGGSSSFPSAKKVVLHKVWDRVLTANDLITGDYVDLISYLDDGLNSSADGNGPTLTTTSTTAAALLSGGHSAPTINSGRDGSVSESAVPASRLGTDASSKKGVGSAATAGTPVRQAPLTFFNPAFRTGATSTCQTLDAAATLPLCQSYPGHLSREATDVSGSIGGTPRPQRPSQWPSSDRFGSLTSRLKQDLPLVTTLQQPRAQLQQPMGTGETLAVTGAACPASQQPQATFPMARRTASGGCSSSAGSSGCSTAIDTSSAAGRTTSPALPPRLAAAGADALLHHAQLAAAEPGDGIGSRRDLSPGESSTWSKGMSAAQSGYSGRDLEWQPSSSGSGYHRSHLDVHVAHGVQQHIAGTPAVDGSRTLPVPRRPHASSPDPERESVELLKQQVEAAQRRLVDTEQRLAQQAEHTDRTIHEWRQRLEASEENLRLQARVKDEQIEGIVQRLMAIEEELRREQREMKDALTQRQRVIELQEAKIRLLNEANTDLLGSLRVLRYHVGHHPTSAAHAQEPSLLLQQHSALPVDSGSSSSDGPASATATAVVRPESSEREVQPSPATMSRRFKTTLYRQTGGGSTACQSPGSSS